MFFKTIQGLRHILCVIAAWELRGEDCIRTRAESGDDWRRECGDGGDLTEGDTKCRTSQGRPAAGER